MVISWTTRDAGAPVVQWTADATTLPFFPSSAPGSTTTYTPADLCGGLDQKLGFFDPGSLQSALMTGLAPATRYWYRVGDTARPRVFPGVTGFFRCRVTNTVGRTPCCEQ